MKKVAKEALVSDLRVVKKRNVEKAIREVSAENAPLRDSKDGKATKKIKALNKKLTAIEELIARQKAGEKLDAQQTAKVESLEEVLTELDGFMSGEIK